jgi:uroporphyrinogen decarboxylase
MHREPGTWRALLDRLADATAAYVGAQARAGADVVQLFDTWAASLTRAEYAANVAPWASQILAAAPCPTIHHVARSEPLLDELAALPSTVVGIDSRQELAAARARVGRDRPVQGNLDAALVLAGSAHARRGAADIIAAGGGDGHVFNLGEAAPRDADPAVLRDLASFVHDRSAVEVPVA